MSARLQTRPRRRARTPARALGRAVQTLRTHLVQTRSPGDRLPPVRQLARQLDCGETNLLRAVQRLAGEGLLVSRPGMGTFVTEAAAQMAGGHDAGSSLRAKTIEIITAKSADPAERDMIDAIARGVTEAGARVRLVERADKCGDEEKQPRIAPTDAYAIVIAEVFRDWPLRVDGDQPIVIASNRPVMIDRSERFDVVTCDNEQGAHLAGRHIRRMGHQTACFLGACPHARISKRRYDLTATHRLIGFELGFGEKLSPSTRIHRQVNNTSGGAAAVPDLLRIKPKPSAVFTSCDELAIGLIHGLRAHGLRPGRDVHVVSFGGLERGRLLEGMELTTIVPPYRTMGFEVVRLLADRLAELDRPPRRIALGCTMHEGTTCARSGRRGR